MLRKAFYTGILVLIANCGFDIEKSRVKMLEFNILEQGFSCANTKQMSVLSENELGILREHLVDVMGASQLIDGINQREKNCIFLRSDDIGVNRSAVSGRYVVEFVEGNWPWWPWSNDGVSATSVYRDNNAMRMCGNDYFSDYIVQYHLNDAYNNLSDLRTKTLNLSTVCQAFVAATTFASRVHDDNDIQMCVGALRWWGACGLRSPQAWEMRLGFE